MYFSALSDEHDDRRSAGERGCDRRWRIPVTVESARPVPLKTPTATPQLNTAIGLRMALKPVWNGNELRCPTKESSDHERNEAERLNEG